ncbi:LuxR C-terminal-related transcriptional regulator [Actinopolymorpha singaporensis]
MSDLSHGVVRALRPAGVANEGIYSAPAVTTTHHNVPSHVPSHVTTTTDLRRRVTDDEIRLLALLADGLPVEAIARRLALSDRTVRRRSRALCDRLGARAPIQVVAWAARNGLI